jgi:hypothetical protein
VWSGVAMLNNHSMSSTRAFFLDRFLQTAKSLTMVFSSDVQVLFKQFIKDNPFHIPPDAQHGRPERGMSLISKLPCLKRANHSWAVLSAVQAFP